MSTPPVLPQPPQPPEEPEAPSGNQPGKFAAQPSPFVGLILFGLALLVVLFAYSWTAIPGLLEIRRETELSNEMARLAHAFAIFIQAIIPLFALWVLLGRFSPTNIRLHHEIRTIRKAQGVAQDLKLQQLNLRTTESLRKEITSEANDDTIAGRLCERLEKEVRLNSFTSTTEVLRGFQESFYEDLNYFDNAKRVGLYLGILGTFVGLAVGLPALSDLTAEASGSDGRISDVHFTVFFTALKTSFVTSISGLICWFFLSTLSGRITKLRPYLFTQLESLSYDALEVFLKSQRDEDIIKSLHDVRRVVEAQSLSVGSSIGELNKNIKNVATLADSMKKVYEVIGTQEKLVDSEFERLNQLQTKITDLQGDVIDKVTSQSAATTLLEGIDKAVSDMTSRLEKNFTELDKRLVRMLDTMRAASQRIRTGGSGGAVTLMSQPVIPIAVGVVSLTLIAISAISTYSLVQIRSQLGEAQTAQTWENTIGLEFYRPSDSSHYVSLGPVPAEVMEIYSAQISRESSTTSPSGPRVTDLCTWLTNRERLLQAIPPDYRYRELEKADFFHGLVHHEISWDQEQTYIVLEPSNLTPDAP